VGLLTLYTGILLPWLGGTLWLVFADAVFAGDARPNRFRQFGYGFFLGYAVLFVAVMTSQSLTGAVSWPAVLVFLSLFGLGGAVAVRFEKKPVVSNPTPAGPTTPVSKILLTMAIALMAIHLVFITVEIYTQPLYPWDAWLAWVYRAKAWYLSGGMADIVSAKTWAIANTADVYTIDAWQYPLFPSVVPYWAALSLGRWSETLVNLPVLCAGLAMGMALYGQCREHGLGIRLSLVACYMLYSIPIIGTHMALAGYADIWMAGFTGLGFVALLRGVMQRADTPGPALQTVLGLLMIIFGAWVKNEGAVWFLASLALIIVVTCRPRVPVLIVAVMAVVGLVAFTTGFSHIQVPWFGTIGFVEGRLVIPFIGSFRLEAHDVLPVYWSNFVKMGSWNLFWLAIAAALYLGTGITRPSPGDRTRRAVLSLVLIVIATQVFIFGFTDQSLWADTYTAINRLPLHFTPALLFIVFVAYRARLVSNSNRTPAANIPVGIDG